MCCSPLNLKAAAKLPDKDVQQPLLNLDDSFQATNNLCLGGLPAIKADVPSFADASMQARRHLTTRVRSLAGSACSGHRPAATASSRIVTCSRGKLHDDNQQADSSKLAILMLIMAPLCQSKVHAVLCAFGRSAVAGNPLQARLQQSIWPADALGEASTRYLKLALS